MKKSLVLAVVLLSQTLTAQSQDPEAALFTGVAGKLLGFTGQNPNLITQGMGTVQQFGQPPSPSAPPSQISAPIQVQQLSSAQSNQAAISACVKSGLPLATCQAMNAPLTSTARTTDDVLVENAIKVSKGVKPGEVVEFLDLNYVAFLMVSFSHVLASYINALGKFDAIDPLTVVQLKPAPINFLTSKTNVPQAISTTPLSWDAIVKNIAARLPKVKFTWASYQNFVVDKSIDRGGVVLIFTNTATNAKRIALVPHPQMKGFAKFASITSQVAKDVGLDLPAPSA